MQRQWVLREVGLDHQVLVDILCKQEESRVRQEAPC